MSYDYSLFNALAPGPMSSWPNKLPDPLGTLDEVKQRLSAIFPDTGWKEFRGTLFGRPTDAASQTPEFQISNDEDGVCRWVTVRRATRAEVESLCRALEVVAVDAQKVELIRP